MGGLTWASGSTLRRYSSFRGVLKTAAKEVGRSRDEILRDGSSDLLTGR